jgi:hypothetical protein
MSGFLVFSVGGRKRSEARRKGSLGWLGVEHAESFQDCLDVVFLRDVEFPIGPVTEDVEPEEVGDRSTIGALKTLIENGFEFIKVLPIVAGVELIIDMDREDQDGILGGSNVETGVGRGGSEIERSKELVECSIEAAR